MPSASEINTFLEQVKAAVATNNYKILDSRIKYMSTLSQLGIVTQDVLDDIKSLSNKETWIKKPDNNPSFPGDVWICKKQLHAANIYIKLKIQIFNGNTLLIMSYHIDGM